MNKINEAIKLISVGLAIGFSLIVYANNNFATKNEVKELKGSQMFVNGLIIKRLDRIENKIDGLKDK
ncbi:MAG: hypothetical protein N4A33_04820 [Bacteriovoracaceae bacterium]|jgi:hypothetical protein|nr:hypothetical protein [Bacteriovoracaceae bacterium]